jgi:hypothetical protein
MMSVKEQKDWIWSETRNRAYITAPEHAKLPKLPSSAIELRTQGALKL